GVGGGEAAVAGLGERLIASGRAVAVRTFGLVPFPYPTRLGLGGAARSPLPYLMMTNRCQLVQFDTPEGTRTLLFNPTDYERSAETPFFAALRRRYGDFLSDKLLSVRRP